MANDNIHLPTQRKVPKEYDQSFWSRFVNDVLNYMNSARTRGLILADKIYLTETVFVSAGSGTPESSLTAPVGSLYLRTDGGANTTLYIKESGTGNTGWAAK